MSPHLHEAFHALTRGFRERPAHTALWSDARRLSYAELDELARRHAAALAELGLTRGDRVAVLATPRVESAAVVLAHYHAGLIHVPVNTRYRQAEVAHILSDAGVAAVVIDAAGRAILDEVAQAEPALAALPRLQLDDGPLGPHEHAWAAPLAPAAATPTPPTADDEIALIIYTSGTTGRSKGVALSMAAVVGAIDALTTLWQWRDDDVLVLALPLFHVHGLAIGVHGALLRGMSISLLPRFDAEAVVAAMAAGGTIFMGVPTMYRLLLDHLEVTPGAAATLARARLFTAGSAALPAADFARFEALTGHRILERYGMSETLLTLSNPVVGERRPGSVGLPVPGFDIRVVDENGHDVTPGQPGELWVRGVGLMNGYWNQPEATRQAFRDGWFLTGDVVARDPDGYVRILGRRSVDIIKSGGFKISAREIEEVLATHPAVAEVAVVGLTDPTWGQRVAAAVVPAPGHEVTSAAGAAALLDTLAGHASAHLADYKKPRVLAVVDELPRNALGKLQKTRLTASWEAGELALVAP
ncbi:AMP-binding protein [Haliangium sp.]|uniref:AMP-binding protein n=1 Tax=Haliangium sp. TaxID=2663208 RepID=UPI003D0E03FB